MVIAPSTVTLPHLPHSDQRLGVGVLARQLKQQRVALGDGRFALGDGLEEAPDALLEVDRLGDRSLRAMWCWATLQHASTQCNM